MADNFQAQDAASVTKNVAMKDASGILHQRVLNESLSATGNPTDVSATNPMPVTIDVGTLLQRIEMLELLLGRLLSGAGAQIPGDGGRTRVSVDAHPASVAGVTKLYTFGSGSVDLYTTQTSLMNLPALMLRDRISIS
jgi:hypothetical protein